MDPSHARKYTKNEIEGIVADLLNAAYPHGVSPPIKIDLLVEQHPEVDELIPVDFRDFDIDALLVCKPDTKTFDILFDENAVRGRISFSIAHEFGHAVLHGEICRECHTIQDAVDLHMRLRNHFTRIEADAQYIASAILMPRRSLHRDAAAVYSTLVREYGRNVQLIQSKVCPALASRYRVTAPAMKIRLERLGLQDEITHALAHGFTSLDIEA